MAFPVPLPVRPAFFAAPHSSPSCCSLRSGCPAAKRASLLVAAVRARSNEEIPPAATATSQNFSAHRDPPALPSVPELLHRQIGSSPANPRCRVSSASYRPPPSKTAEKFLRRLSRQTSVLP